MYQAKEDIQDHEKSSQVKENICFLLQRKQRLPPPLTEEEINKILNMQLASHSLCNQEIHYICPTFDLCIEVFPPKETNVEQIDVDVVAHPQESLLLEITFSHQNDGLQAESSNLSQDISYFLEDNIMVYHEYATSDNQGEYKDILF